MFARVGAFVARFGTAAGAIAAMNWVFNYPVTVGALWLFGPVAGNIALVILGTLLNYISIVWYKRTTADWFGLEWLRMQESTESDSRSGRIIRAALRRSRLLAFVAISGLVDPIYGFIYQRGRESGRHFSLADWWWFALANIIGMAIWFAGWTAAVEGSRALLT